MRSLCWNPKTELHYDLNSYKDFLNGDCKTSHLPQAHDLDFWKYFTGAEGVCEREDISPISYEEWLCLLLPVSMRHSWL
jgi:hypothetical protein